MALAAVEQTVDQCVAPMKAAIATLPVKDRGFAGAPQRLQTCRELGSIATCPSITMY
jgi:hypothetical protein